MFLLPRRGVNSSKNKGGEREWNWPPTSTNPNTPKSDSANNFLASRNGQRFSFKQEFEETTGIGAESKLCQIDDAKGFCAVSMGRAARTPTSWVLILCSGYRCCLDTGIGVSLILGSGYPILLGFCGKTTQAWHVNSYKLNQGRQVFFSVVAIITTLRAKLTLVFGETFACAFGKSVWKCWT